MTASQILNHWRAVSGVFRQKPISWLALLRIAEAGEQGISRTELSRSKPCLRCKRSIKLWHEAGLITITPGAASPRGDNPSHIVRITPKGMWLLRING